MPESEAVARPDLKLVEPDSEAKEVMGPGSNAASRPTQSEMPFAIVDGEAITELPQDLYIPPHALEVFLEAFEGPLDLLLYLIRRQNLDIIDIPINEITRQYVEYIDLMDELQLDLVGERLHFQRISGSGPSKGWISISLKEKILARRLKRQLPNSAAAVNGNTSSHKCVDDGIDDARRTEPSTSEVPIMSQDERSGKKSENAPLGKMSFDDDAEDDPQNDVLRCILMGTFP